jgi:hypothetical protein
VQISQFPVSNRDISITDSNLLIVVQLGKHIMSLEVTFSSCLHQYQHGSSAIFVTWDNSNAIQHGILKIYMLMKL